MPNYGKSLRSLKTVLTTIALVVQLMSSIKLIQFLFCLIKCNRCGSKSWVEGQDIWRAAVLFVTNEAWILFNP